VSPPSLIGPFYQPVALGVWNLSIKRRDCMHATCPYESSWQRPRTREVKI